MKGSLLIAIGLCSLFAAGGIPAPSVVINEIAWGGSASNPRAEWIELLNGSGSEIDLAGWRLISSDGAPDITLSGKVAPLGGDDPAAGYFLLVREGGGFPALEADLVYPGALTDRGETLYLYDPEGNLVDTANLREGGLTGWPGGTNGRGSPPFCSMERIDYRLPDRPDNWTTCDCGGEDRTGLCGTPKRENSAFNLPPSAGMTITPAYPSPGEEIVFDAGPSRDENDRIVSYRWDFGDGSTGKGQTASHTYAEVGEYPVTLTVLDSKGGEATATRSIALSFPIPPIADFSVIPEEGIERPRVGSPLRFQDESSGDGIAITGWAWDFGDGSTGEGESVLHAYTDPGLYVVSLTVTDEQGRGATQTGSISIASLPPEAKFIVDPAVPTAGRPAEFDASESSDPDGKVANYRWDFDGDGTIDLEAEEATVTHTYQAGGTVPVTLWIVDDNGDISDPLRMEIEVNSPPVAGFCVSEFAPMELVEVKFTDCSYDDDGTIVAWEWDFGDGATSCQRSPKYAFRAEGDYTVSLTVVDDDGGSGKTEARLIVHNLPPVASLDVNCPAQPTGGEFTFDASSSRDQSPDGRIVRYEWDLDDDGTFDLETTSPTLPYAYPDDGSYRVRVRVTDDDGATATSDPVKVRVENRPAEVSRIDYSPPEPKDGEAVALVPLATDPDGTIVGWGWEFGDGSTSDVQTPFHTFQDDGVYRVVLTVTDDDGGKTLFEVEIDVENSPPRADFTARVEGVEVAFDGRASYDPSPTGRIAHVAWNFGDGTSWSGGCDGTDRFMPVHTFPGLGLYTVTLVVIDEDGAIGRIEYQIRITG